MPRTVPAPHRMQRLVRALRDAHARSSADWTRRMEGSSADRSPRRVTD